jgi:hypothetical protein
VGRSFEGSERRDGTRCSVMEDEGQAVRWSAHANLEKSPVREFKELRGGHAVSLARSPGLPCTRGCRFDAGLRPRPNSGPLGGQYRGTKPHKRLLGRSGFVDAQAPRCWRGGRLLGDIRVRHLEWERMPQVSRWRHQPWSGQGVSLGKEKLSWAEPLLGRSSRK